MTRYAYVHARPETVDATGVFYVGKGRGVRCAALPARNRYHGFVLEKYGAENILIGKIECSDDATAFELERGLIKCFRRAGVQLTNMTDGGDGTTGHVVTEEGIARRSAQMKALWANPDLQERMHAARKNGNKRSWDTCREGRAAALRGVKKTLSEAALAARRANLAKATSPEGRAKHAERSKDQWKDPERKAKQAEGLRRAWQDPVKRAAMLSNRKGLAERNSNNTSGSTLNNTSDKEN